MNNYFSFSLYKSDRANFDHYANGALINYQTIKQKYPNFKCRFYIDDKTIDNKYVKMLLDTDAEIILKENIYNAQKAVLWRFQPLIDDDFNVCFFRDCDSRITEREDNLIKLFLESDKSFHVIRDYPHKNKILAGMWGVKKTTNDMEKCILDLYNMDDTYGFEEYYFEKTMWEYIKNDLLLHDYKITPHLFIRNVDNTHIGQPFK